MKVITEAELRVWLAKGEGRVLALAPGDRLTGPARDYAREQGIALEQGLPSRDFPDGFVDERGTRYREKPEDMTHLRGNLLVAKTHPRIVLRGRLDGLQALIIVVQTGMDEPGGEKLLADLQELLEYVRQVLSAEVRETPFAAKHILGYAEAELRAASHHPQAHFGCGHILPSRQMGKAGALLNLLRTRAREAELCAAQAFPQGERPDLIRALNRLSSAFYVMMCRESTGYYGG